MRILLFAITILAYLSTVVGETTTFEPTTEMGSGEEESTTPMSIPTTTTETPDPCEGKCGIGQKCPVGCDCEDEGEMKLARSLDDFCAEPCDFNYVWCSNERECSPSENGNDFSCVCGANEYAEGETCSTGKYFGGQIVFTLDHDQANSTIIEGILNGMYNGTDSFVKSEVLSITAGSTVVDYRLIYTTVTNVTADTIQSSYFSATKNCTTDNWGTTFENYTINCARSYDKTTESGILCKNRDPSCDEITTTCEESDGGFVPCQCKDKINYRKATSQATMCLRIPCLSDSDCNSPFGSCNTNEEDELMSYCDCMWGFEGASCQEPWGFVFTILAGAFGVILIIVLTVCICNMRKSKSTKDDKPEDMNLKNPFVDFQPGLVRAKVPNNMYSVSDTYDMTTRDSGGRNNGAYDHAHDDAYGKQTSSFQHEYQSLDNNRRSGASADYF